MRISAELADQLTTDVIHFLQDKYPGIDTFTAMEALFREWNGEEGDAELDEELAGYESSGWLN